MQLVPRQALGERNGSVSTRVRVREKRCPKREGGTSRRRSRLESFRRKRPTLLHTARVEGDSPQIRALGSLEIY
jgi:hypothetical protein